MKRLDQKRKRWIRRKQHIRKSLHGTTDRPRMSVFKSNKYIYIQVIDDENGKTVAALSNLQKENKSVKSNVEGAAKLGEQIGQKLVADKFKTIVFDRNGYPYHGIVKAVADGARKAGLQF
ncbi:MAG: 50S ribosomal protein L18 [Spirochaetia bacterium]